MEFDAVIEEIRQQIEPDRSEREALAAAVEELTDRTASALADQSVDATVLQVGSTARDTWLAGDRDIDLFVCFPPTVNRETLESVGLDIGHEVLPDSHEEYAEHPYVVGEFEGFRVDLVPCYAVEDPSEIRSAVDRTPFHTRYVTEQLTPELANAVRVCKQFFEGIGVYGSDLKTRGFSGFLTELLVIEHDGFRPLIEAAANWDPPVRFDPAAHGSATFDDPLVVIDPTDPERNVAAVLSETNLARFQHFSRELLEEPRKQLFEPHEPEPISAATVTECFQQRETTPVAVCFETPDIVTDQLWPQLERSRAGIARELNRRGFDVFRSDAFTADRSVLLFELAVDQRPAIERHEGPPVAVREHARRFYQSYTADEDGTDQTERSENSYGPFIDGDRYVVERPREFTTATAFLESQAIFEVALGAHVETALQNHYDVYAGDAVGTLTDSFGSEFARYLSPSPRGNRE